MQFEKEREDLRDQLRHAYQNPDSFDFENFALALFFFQYQYNKVYKQYSDWLHKNTENVRCLSDIPLMPISAFKNYRVVNGEWQEQTTFKSSGTTSSNRSIHYVRDTSFYLNHAQYLWEKQFGKLSDFRFIALLPGYIDRGESSLVAMVQYFIDVTKSNGSCAITKDYNDVIRILNADIPAQKTVLFGVSFALLTLLEHQRFDFPELIIMETGGMKGLRENMRKEELQHLLQLGFGTQKIYSEYGMTELFSQAYAKGPLFESNPFLQIYIRQIQDPLSEEKAGKQGIVGCIDLANIDSCAFILTEDSGIKYDDGKFQLTGRLDNADARGCNLLLSDVMS